MSKSSLVSYQAANGQFIVFCCRAAPTNDAHFDDDPPLDQSDPRRRATSDDDSAYTNSMYASGRKTTPPAKSSRLYTILRLPPFHVSIHSPLTTQELNLLGSQTSAPTCRPCPSSALRRAPSALPALSELLSSGPECRPR